MPKTKKKILLSEIGEQDKLKYEIAAELGLLDRILDGGWGTLSARETGRVGGLLRQRHRERNSIPTDQSEDD